MIHNMFLFDIIKCINCSRKTDEQNVSNMSLNILSGVDVTANQEEISDHETFQMEFDQQSKRWYMRTMQDKYFTLQGGGGIQASETKRLFHLSFI